MTRTIPGREVRRMTFSRVVTLALAMFVAACGSGTDVTNLVGLWQATQFTVTTNGVTKNWLEAGGSIQLILSENQTSGGTMFVPGGNSDGSDFTADLSGTWSISNGKVYFEQAADSFIRDMPFTVAGNTLVGDQVFGASRVQITLTLQE